VPPPAADGHDDHVDYPEDDLGDIIAAMDEEPDEQEEEEEQEEPELAGQLQDQQPGLNNDVAAAAAVLSDDELVGDSLDALEAAFAGHHEASKTSLQDEIIKRLLENEKHEHRGITAVL
jgi:hypothetical protein